MIINSDTFESSLESISSYYYVSRDDIYNELLDFDMNKHHSNKRHLNYGDKVLHEVFNEKYIKRNTITEIHWFHLTRVSINGDFEGSIKPLGKQIEHIWSYLYELVKELITESDWNKFKNGISNSGNEGILYKLKMSNPFHWGPYAMLVKGVAFKSKEMGNHDYLNAPEIIEDICLGFSSVFNNINLLEKYAQSTVPSIVHFRSREVDHKVIGPILLYLYNTIRNKKLSIHCNTCFDGQGKEIPESDIIKVERLDEIPYYFDEM